MTQEEKFLLFQDLCARLPYGVKIDYPLIIDNPLLENIVSGIFLDIRSIDIDHVIAYMPDKKYKIDLSKVKPYLRPMSSMTIEEICKIESIIGGGFIYRNGSFTLNTENVITIPICKMSNLLQFMYQRHLDFNNLIPMGLALEAPEGMYKNY